MEGLTNKLQRMNKIEQYLDEGGKTFGLAFSEKKEICKLINLVKEEKEISEKLGAIEDNSGKKTKKRFDTEPGMRLIMVNKICEEGMDFMIHFYGDELGKRFPGKFLASGKIKEIMQKADKAESSTPDLEDMPDLVGSVLVANMVDMENSRPLDPSDSLRRNPEEIMETLQGLPTYYVGEGGMYKVLNQISKDLKRGFTVEYEKVPVNQAAVEFAEYFSLDPWQLFCGNGCFIYVETDFKTGIKAEQTLKEQGNLATCIGRIGLDNRKIISHYGVESLLNRAQADELLNLIRR